MKNPDRRSISSVCRECVHLPAWKAEEGPLQNQIVINVVAVKEYTGIQRLAHIFTTFQK